MSSLPVPPFLNGHVPNGNDKAKLIDALVTFGQWVKQTTDTARQAAEAAAASVNAENIIQRALARAAPIPFKIDVVTASKTVPIPRGAKACKVTVRAGAYEPWYYSNNKYKHQMPNCTHWLKINGETEATVTIGASGSSYYIGHSLVQIGSKKVKGYKTSAKPNNSSDWLYEESEKIKDIANTIDGIAVLEWYINVPEGVL